MQINANSEEKIDANCNSRTCKWDGIILPGINTRVTFAHFYSNRNSNSRRGKTDPECIKDPSDPFPLSLRVREEPFLDVVIARKLIGRIGKRLKRREKKKKRTHVHAYT